MDPPNRFVDMSADTALDAAIGQQVEKLATTRTLEYVSRALWRELQWIAHSFPAYVNSSSINSSNLKMME
jgi:hypothetical protein